MFYIKLIDDINTGIKQRTAEICLGPDKERLVLPFAKATEQDYKRQWKKAVDAIAMSDSSAASLIAELPVTGEDDYVTTWVLYREKNDVYIHNILVFRDQFDHEFSEENITYHPAPRETTNEDGFEVSEWRVPFHEIATWAKHLD